MAAVLHASYENNSLPKDVSLSLRTFFYAVTPGETSFEKIGDVPNYVDRVSYFFNTDIYVLLTRFVATSVKYY